MKFGNCVLLAAISAHSATAFAPMMPRTAQQQGAKTTSSLNALEDLEAKLLGTPEPAPTKKAAKPAPAPKPAPKPAASIPQSESLSAAKAEKPKPTPKAEKPKPAPKAEKPKPEPKPEKPKPTPKVKAVAPPPPKPVPKPAAQTDASTIPKGVALGAAPLVVVPLVALAAGRDFLSKTVARRAAIQEEIAAREAALAKKKANAEIDFGGVVGATVRCCVVS